MYGYSLPLAVFPLHFGPHLLPGSADCGVMRDVTKAPLAKALGRKPPRPPALLPRHSPEDSQCLSRVCFSSCAICSDLHLSHAFLMGRQVCPQFLPLTAFLRTHVVLPPASGQTMYVQVPLNIPPHPSVGNLREFPIICNHKHLIHIWSG